MRVNDQVEAIFDKINDMLRTKDFSDLDMVLEMRDKLFDTIVEAIKSQLRRINGDETVSTRASVLYLTILNETKTMILQARNLLKSQHYFWSTKNSTGLLYGHHPNPPFRRRDFLNAPANAAGIRQAARQKRHPQKAAGNRPRRRIFPDRAAFVAGT